MITAAWRVEWRARLDNALARKGWSKADLARALQVVPQSVSNLYDRANPRLSTVWKLADVLECPPDDLTAFPQHRNKEVA